MEKYKNKTFSPKERAMDLLSRMTLKEKVGQIAQPFQMFREYDIVDGEIVLKDHFKDFVIEHGGIGTVFSFFRADPWSGRTFDAGITAELRQKAYNTLQRFVVENSRLNIPTLFEENAPHGLQVLDSVLYPTNIGSGATFDAELCREMAQHIAEECKTFGVQVPNATLYNVICDPRFGRNEETFSEDPILCAKLAAAVTKGYKDGGTMICGKEYCAQGAAQGGHCGGVATIGKRELYEIHFPAVVESVKEGVDFIMPSYTCVEGEPCHSSKHLLRDILQDEMGFEGVIRADRTGNDFLGDRVLSGAMALNAGMMLGLGDVAFTHLEEAVEKGYTDEATIDDAVLHILIKKFESGVMDQPYIEEDGTAVEYLKNGISKECAYRVAAESLVLLKNEGDVLPLKNQRKIALFGEHAINVYTTLGDYTPPQRQENCPTLLDALKAANPDTTYSQGWDFLKSDADFENALNIAKQSDLIITTLGGSSARDFHGVYNEKGQTVETKINFMDCGEGRDVSDLSLPGNQIEFLNKLKELGKPVIGIVYQGRPYVIKDAINCCDAVVIAWYPGQEGANAIVDTLFGKNNCFGRLPVSLPNSSSVLPVNYNMRPFGRNYIDANGISDFPFGSGLTYSKVEYTKPAATVVPTKEEIEKGAKVTITLEAENQSDMAVKEVVMVFLRNRSNNIVCRNRELKSFCRVELGPHERKEINIELDKSAFEIFGTNGKFVLEPHWVEAWAGGSMQNLKTCGFDIR